MSQPRKVRRAEAPLESHVRGASVKLVIYPALAPAAFARVVEHAWAGSAVNCSTAAEALEAIGDADSFFGAITPEILAAARRLRWIQAPTTGLDRFVFPALIDHPSILTNMRGWNAAPIADQVMGYVLCFARNLHLYVRQQLGHRWAPIGVDDGRLDVVEVGEVSPLDRAVVDLRGSTLGVVGLGAIGRATAVRARAFGMDIVAASRRVSDRPSTVRELWDMDNLERLLTVADFVVIAAPLTSATKGLIGLHELEAMKRSAYLINVGRGPIVKLDDLTAALGRRLIAGAALDVFEEEPLPPDHPLWSLDNVIITPHVAGYSASLALRRLEILLENLDRRATGRPLINVVDKRAAL